MKNQKKKSPTTTSTSSFNPLVGMFITVVLSNSVKVHGALLWHDKTFLYIGDSPESEEYRVMARKDLISIITVGNIEDLALPEMGADGPIPGDGVH